MSERNPVQDAVRYALTAGVAASFVGAPAATFAEDDVAVQDKVTVTGSRIKRVDIEGPSPISVISREDIDATGDISVAEVLRGSTYNQFGSFKQRSGSSAQSQSTVNLRGLGANRTLVLVDGRRIVGSPTFGAGSAQNLNTIPLAAVERIEILRDGASAIYGSDAIGGVVNVILRKDYEGMNLKWSIGRPTQTGGDEDTYSVVGGISSGRGNITFGFDVEKKEIIFQGDRSFSQTGLSAFGFPSSYFGYLTTDDPRNPAQAFQDDTDDDGTADSNLASTFLSVGTFPDPRCPTSLGTDPEFPDSQLSSGGTFCQYNYAGVAANESENDTKSFFINVNYDISDTTAFFARGTFTFNESFGRYAPSPFTSPLPTLSQSNNNNPTIPGETNTDGDAFAGQTAQADTDGDGTADTTVDGPFDLSLYYRNVGGGFRDTRIEDTLVDYMAGVQGTVDWLGGMDWELAGQWSQQTSNSASPGLGLVSQLQEDIDQENFDVYAVNTDFGPDQARFQADASFDGIFDARHRIVSIDGAVNFDAFQLNAGPVPVALGFEYRDEDFEQNYDAQQNANNVAGSSGGLDVSGARAVKSLFGETSIPILDNLDISLAGRYDDYNDFGTTFNPKVSVSYRPIDSLLLRGTYGEGFRAPSMNELYSAQSQSFDGAIDRFRCSQDPADTNGDGSPDVDLSTLPSGNPCLLTQYQNLTGGNTDLDAEESEQWNVGMVFNPLDDLSFSLDYYDIEIEEEIGTLSLQTLIDQEFQARQDGVSGQTVGAVTRLNNGRIDFVDASNQNIAVRETTGIDVNATYSFSIGRIGDFRTQFDYTHVIEYERDQGDGNGKRRLQGTFDPEDRASLAIAWARGDFSANVIGNYIDRASNGTGSEVASYTTWDLNVGWSTPWNGQVTAGARNILDKDPPTDVNIGSPFYSNQLHDVYGRVPYIRYEQDL